MKEILKYIEQTHNVNGIIIINTVIFNLHKLRLHLFIHYKIYFIGKLQIQIISEESCFLQNMFYVA